MHIWIPSISFMHFTCIFEFSLDMHFHCLHVWIFPTFVWDFSNHITFTKISLFLKMSLRQSFLWRMFWAKFWRNFGTTPSGFPTYSHHGVVNQNWTSFHYICFQSAWCLHFSFHSSTLFQNSYSCISREFSLFAPSSRTRSHWKKKSERINLVKFNLSQPFGKCFEQKFWWNFGTAPLTLKHIAIVGLLTKLNFISFYLDARVFGFFKFIPFVLKHP